VEPKLGDIVFDIGAYVGDTALWFSKAVGPQGKVYAFEPEPSNFEKLKANLERNKVTTSFLCSWLFPKLKEKCKSRVLRVRL